MKLVAGVLAVLCVVALGFYFYERAKELKIAEEKAQAVGERVFEIGPAATPVVEDGAGQE